MVCMMKRVNNRLCLEHRNSEPEGARIGVAAASIETFKACMCMTASSACVTAWLELEWAIYRYFWASLPPIPQPNQKQKVAAKQAEPKKP